MSINRLFYVLIVVFLTVTACAPQGAPTSLPTEPIAEPISIPEITIDAADFSYTAPESINAGWVRVKLTNSGKEPHHVEFLRLNDDVTFEGFHEAMKSGPGAEMTVSKLMGGVGAIAPTGAAQVVLHLPAGNYVLICFVPSPSDNVPHLAKGMIKTLTVQESTSAAKEPVADLSITMKDFLFDLPETLPAGPRTIKVTNNGPEPHELNLLRLEEGKTLEDVNQFLAAPNGPPPFLPVGGINGLDAGLSGYIEFDFQPGKYVAICYIPSPHAQGHPHFTLGMVKEFTVTANGHSAFPSGKFIQSGKTNYGLLFNQDGTFSVFEGSNTFVRGTYSVDGNIFTETSNDAGCKTNVDFTYTFDGTNLTFNYVGDPDDDMGCAGRHADFNDVTYVLTP
jgi:hypothetical protein